MLDTTNGVPDTASPDLYRLARSSQGANGDLLSPRRRSTSRRPAPNGINGPSTFHGAPLEPDVLDARIKYLRRNRFLEKGELGDAAALLDKSQRDLGYRPLENARFETRFVELLDLGDDNAENPVRCHLIHQSLISPPDYAALSYCWGDTQDEVYIVLNDTRIPVSHNLECALRELRRRRVKVVWVDFLSINQVDACERSFQLLRSSQIYAMASKVIAWLGPAGHDSDSAMGLLQQFDLSKRMLRKRPLSRPPRPEHSLTNGTERMNGDHEPKVNGNLLNGERNLKSAASGRSNRNSGCFRDLSIIAQMSEVSVFDALDKLWTRSYFERAWVIQEVSTAWTVELLCGTEAASLDAVAEYVKFVDTPETPYSLPEPVRVLLHFRERERTSYTGEARMVLLEALISSRLSLTSDPRDKIYSLLALTRDAKDVVPTPNYVVSAETALLNVSANMLTVQGQTALMLLASRAASVQSTLPSWAPDWNNMRHDQIPPWIIKCITQKREPMRHMPSLHRRTLTVRAIPLEQILSMSGQRQSIPVADEAYEVDEVSVRDAFVTLWETLAELSDGTHKASRAAKVAALKTFLEESKSRRAAEIGGLMYGPRSLDEWLMEFREALACSTSRQAIKSSPEYRMLKDSVRLMSANSLKLAVCGKDWETDTFRLVHKKAHVGEWIWRVQNCALPMVLRNVTPGRPVAASDYQLIGEVFLKNLDEPFHWACGTGWQEEDFDQDAWLNIGIV